jgi:hypothetical protein
MVIANVLPVVPLLHSRLTHLGSGARGRKSLARSADSRLHEAATRWAAMGTELFLALAVERDEAGLLVILTASDAVDPIGCVPVWCVALSAELSRGGTFTQFADVVRLWLDAVVARPDLWREGGRLRPVAPSGVAETAADLLGIVPNNLRLGGADQRA